MRAPSPGPGNWRTSFSSIFAIGLEGKTRLLNGFHASFTGGMEFGLRMCATAHICVQGDKKSDDPSQAARSIAASARSLPEGVPVLRTAQTNLSFFPAHRRLMKPPPRVRGCVCRRMTAANPNHEELFHEQETD